MKPLHILVFAILFLLPALQAENKRPEIRVAQYLEGNGRNMLWSNYPGALMSLLEHVGSVSNANIIPEPTVLNDLSNKELLNYPFLYISGTDVQNWDLPEACINNLRHYLEHGGFIFVDAGITASFLRENQQAAASHSYAEWEASPKVKALFNKILPSSSFAPVPRKDELFHVFYDGLPDTSTLPDSVREYVIKEKWPEGTYSAVAIRNKTGRICVLCTPIIAMGWARNSLGQWVTNIQFRVLEQTEGLNQLLEKAAYSGARFEIVREDRNKDIIYCQNDTTPSWCMEPDGRWRVFRYYSSREISDFAHQFYTRLGTNILIYALVF